jgi:hypothetical protein
MDQRGWDRRYLLPAFGGSSSRMSEAMTRKRPLSISQIRCLVFNYGMNADDMIRWYPTEMQPTEPVNVFAVINDMQNKSVRKAQRVA